MPCVSVVDKRRLVAGGKTKSPLFWLKYVSARNILCAQSSFITETEMNKISFRNDILPLKDKLYRLALRITLNARDAEDIVQDTLIKVWNRRDRWDELDSIEAFSLTVCRNLALDSIKRKGHNNPSIEDAHADRPDLTANPYEEMLHNDRVKLVRDIINALPEKQKTSMQLREFEGKSYREIAQIMEVTEEQVKINIFRARQAIKQKFKNADDYGL